MIYKETIYSGVYPKPYIQYKYLSNSILIIDDLNYLQNPTNIHALNKGAPFLLPNTIITK